MKLSDKLRALKLQFQSDGIAGVEGEISVTPLNTPSMPIVLNKITAKNFVRGVMDCELGYPAVHSPLPNSLYVCFVVDENNKIEFSIETPESENLWLQIKKSMVDEFAHRFARIQ